MQLPVLLALAGLSAGLQASDIILSPTDSSDFPTGDRFNLTTTNTDDVHTNILDAWNPEHIIESNNLLKYYEDNKGANHTLYLNDTRSFVDLSTLTVSPETKRSSKRVPPHNICSNFKSPYVVQSESWFDQYNPASSCLNADGKGSGALTSTWTYSKSIASNVGLDFKLIKDILGAAAGVTVTETWSHSDSFTCNVPSRHSGQLWISTRIVWGWIWVKDCRSCVVGGVTCSNNGQPKGTVVAPANVSPKSVDVRFRCRTVKNINCKF